MGNLFCIFSNFLVRQLYCNQQVMLQKNLFLKISQHSPENTCAVSFYKVIGLQPSGLQNRYFLVNNMKFLRTPILKNTCEPLTSAFSSQLFEAVGKKSVLKTKWQKLINKYEKKSLKCVIKPVLKTFAEQQLSSVEFEIDVDIKSTPIWISYNF